MVTNCRGEYSFSKMKLIKNRLRALMTQNCLSDLIILSDIIISLDFSLVTKSRRVPILFIKNYTI